jgi:membrane protein
MGMMDALNMAYDQDESRSYFKKKILSVMTTLLTLVLIISALVLPNIGVYVVSFLRKFFYIPQVPELLFNIVKFVLASGIFFTILATLYFALPNCKLKIKEILPGTGFSFIGLLIISNLFGYFVKEFSRYSLVYGGLAAVIILMMWLYLCGHIIMIGGEINAMTTQKYKENHSKQSKKKGKKSDVKPSLFFRRKG